MEAGGSHEDLGVLEGAENFTLPSEVKDKSWWEIIVVWFPNLNY